MKPSAALLLLALAGCASGGSYPSLATRPVEARGWQEPAPPPTPTATPDPALDGRLATLTQTLADSGRAFDGAVAVAMPLVRAAHGQPAGGERWIAAQSALADLDARRAASAEPASTLEDLAGDRAQALQPDYPALEAARTAAAALLDREAATIRDLQGRLPQG